MGRWAESAVFYHIYPLGLCGAPEKNDLCSAPQPRLERLHEWAGHLQEMGATALYLGPVFESGSHGYDTADYLQVDRRLGTGQQLREAVAVFKRRNIRVILDAVFNHVGRDFWAFRDVQQNRERSRYCGWFESLEFGKRNPCGDDFTYANWGGHFSLVKLNLRNPEVKEHLLEAAAQWIRDYDIDGLRLDAADCVDLGFLGELARRCRGLRPDFWLLGEVIHGDYRKWANPGCLDSVTNYEAYKGLYSSLNDKNYFEIAWTLNRQYGAGGIYNGLHLYNFADNHDVDRVASTLKDPRHLYPLYCLLYTMPGIPSLYYGSEAGWAGKKLPGTDAPLRPELQVSTLAERAPQPPLLQAIKRLAGIRNSSDALRHGGYRQLFVSGQQFAFLRGADSGNTLVALNSSAEASTLKLNLSEFSGRTLADLLNPGWTLQVSAGETALPLPPHSARIAAIE